MFLFLLSFLSFDLPNKLFDSSELIPLSNGKTFLSTHPKWYFVHYETINDLTVIKKRFPNIKFDTLSLHHDNYLTLFLTASEARQLNSISNLQVYSRPATKKIQNDNLYQQLYLVQAHKSFQNSKSPKILSSIGQFYIVKSNPSEIESNPSVLFYEELPPIYTNNRWSTGLIQTGNEETVIENGYQTSNRKFNHLGINGSNVIVTLIDSGADIHNCLFHDPKIPVPMNQTNLSHRKIVRYDPFVDGSDQFAGHGTHCAGIIAGSVDTTPMNLYNGHAPGSKLYIADVGLDKEDEMELDLSYFDRILVQSKKLGSPIVSCSWGSNETIPSLRVMFDYLSYKDPSQLYVFAAGNEGELYSVGSPGDSKNVLTVGATNPSRPWFRGYSSYNIIQFHNGDKIVNVTSPNMNIALERYGESYFLNIPIVQYSQDKNPSEFSNSIVYIETQENVTKILDMLSENNARFAAVYQAVNLTHDNIVVLEINDVQKSFLLSNSITNITIETTRGYDNLTTAYFSSRGPSFLGNLKPDVMAPGFYIMSAGQHPTTEQCNVESSLLYMSGTSMATPAVSGALALIYQYLNDARHNLTVTKTMNITSALLRAFAISAAGGTANCESGYGLVNLSRVLIFEDDHKGLRYCSSKINPDQHLSYYITTVREGELSITLTWIDLPFDADVTIPLFTYIDLVLVAPDGSVFETKEQYATSRKLVIPNAKPGQYEIRIASNALSAEFGGVDYSIVVLGAFDHLNLTVNQGELIAEKSRLCTSKCTSQCNEDQAICICDKSHTGTFCDIEVRDVPMDSEISTILSHQVTSYLRLNIEEIVKKDASKKNLFFRVKADFNQTGLLRYFINTDNSVRLNIPRGFMAISEDSLTELKLPLTDLQKVKSLYFTVYNDVYDDVNLRFIWTYDTNLSFMETLTFKILIITVIVLASTIIVVATVYIIYRNFKMEKQNNDDISTSLVSPNDVGQVLIANEENL